MIVPTVSLLYLFCFIDRANIGTQEWFTSNPFNELIWYKRQCQDRWLRRNSQTERLRLQHCFERVLYILHRFRFVGSFPQCLKRRANKLEIPSNIACKWIGPGWFIPFISLCFGICSVGTAFVSTKAQACGVRFLLGVFEAGMMPGIAYYLSRWYRRSELTFRLGLYIVMAPLAGAFGGLLASGILRLEKFGSTKSWEMIFAIEGIITIVLSVISFFTLTDRPETARWLSQEEKDLAVARVKSERVQQTEVLDKLDTTKTLRGILSPITLATSLIFLLNNITVQGLAFFAPTIISTIYTKESTVTKQLKTVPPYIVGAFFVLLFPFASWRYDRRIIFFIMSAPLMMIGYIMFLATDSTPGDSMIRYGATFIIASGAYAFGPLTNGNVASNVISDTARGSAIGTNVRPFLPIFSLPSSVN